MTADYDSKADALLISLTNVDWWDDEKAVDETYCHVAFRKGAPAGVELLNPRDHLGLLRTAAQRFGLDPEAIVATANAALAAPDRVVTVEVAAATAPAAA